MAPGAGDSPLYGPLLLEVVGGEPIPMGSMRHVRWQSGHGLLAPLSGSSPSVSNDMAACSLPVAAPSPPIGAGSKLARLLKNSPWPASGPRFGFENLKPSISGR